MIPAKFILPELTTEELLAMLAEQGVQSVTAAFAETKHRRYKKGTRIGPGGEGGGRFAPKFTGRVGVTPFRPEDTPEGFFDSPKFAAFEKSLADAAEQNGVTITGQERVQGFWLGEQEPSLAVEAHDGEDGVRAFAEQARAEWDQDGVLLFDYDPAGDALSFRLTGGSGKDYAEALTAAGIQGATIHGDGVEVIGDDSVIDQVEDLRTRLGIDPADVVVKRGVLSFAERPA